MAFAQDGSEWPRSELSGKMHYSPTWEIKTLQDLQPCSRLASSPDITLQLSIAPGASIMPCASRMVGAVTARQQTHSPWGNCKWSVRSTAGILRISDTQAESRWPSSTQACTCLLLYPPLEAVEHRQRKHASFSALQTWPPGGLGLGIVEDLGHSGREAEW